MGARKQESRRRKYVYDFPRPMVTVDVILLAWREERLSLLLIKRRQAPYRGYWALPGGFVNEDESLEKAARRELEEEAAVRPPEIEQLHAFGDPGRDPRGRSITITYVAFSDPRGRDTPRPGSDASDARWFPVNRLPRLAFDHRKIVRHALTQLRRTLYYSAAAARLLPESFRLTELQDVCEAILARKLSRSGFRRKMRSLGFLRRDPGTQLYSFRERQPKVGLEAGFCAV